MSLRAMPFHAVPCHASNHIHQQLVCLVKGPSCQIPPVNLDSSRPPGRLAIGRVPFVPSRRIALHRIAVSYVISHLIPHNISLRATLRPEESYLHSHIDSCLTSAGTKLRLRATRARLGLTD